MIVGEITGKSQATVSKHVCINSTCCSCDFDLGSEIIATWVGRALQLELELGFCVARRYALWKLHELE